MDAAEKVKQLVGQDYADNYNRRMIAMGYYGDDMTAEQGWDNVVKQETIKGIKQGIRTCASRNTERAVKRRKVDHELVNVMESYPLAPISEWMFLTASPDTEHQNVNMLMKAINKFVKKSHNTCAMWCIEQRSRTEEEMGKGIHCHILLKSHHRSAYDFQTAYHDSFKHMMTIQWSIINYIRVKPEHITNRYNYISGNKKDKGKCDMVKIDKLWRLKEGLNDVYSTKNFDQLYEEYLKRDIVQDDDYESDDDAGV